MTFFRRALHLALLIPAAAGAQDFQSHAAIDAQVSNALAGSGTTAKPVDRRLKLAACPEPLRIDPPVLGAIALNCPARGWRLRVSLEESAGGLAPVVIKHGDPVSVSFSEPGYSVTTSGIAESEARVGERVRVRVQQKADRVMGEAIGAGSVRVRGLN